jgi:iron complex outermembrane receptor protein
MVQSVLINDVKADFASSYNCLASKPGFKRSLGAHAKIDIFAAVDNLLDETYSLGNDINAASNRLLKAAPRQNWSVGIGVGVVVRAKKS